MGTAFLAWIAMGCFDCGSCSALTRVDVQGATAEGNWRVRVQAEDIVGACEIGGPDDDSGAVCDPGLRVTRDGDDLHLLMDEVYARSVVVRVSLDGVPLADRQLDTRFVVHPSADGCDYAVATVDLR